VSLWRAALRSPRLALALPDSLPALLEGLQPARPLVVWLESLALALAQCGLWDNLTSDPAGQQMIQALRLGEGAAQELVRVTDALAATAADGTTPARTATRSGSKLSLSGFTAWVRDVLEGASFMPRGEGEPDVVILPMAQLLGRAFAATVVPGCDEVHLNPSPEPPGQWTAAQREALGLPTREVLALAAAQAWQATLALPQLDLMWRTQERGETLQASPWIQALPGFGTDASADPRPQRTLQPLVQQRPQPAAGDVLPESLSASANQDQRDCPYRFFALRQLRQVDAPELQAAPHLRYMANWLPAVWRASPQHRGDRPPARAADRAELNRLADATADSMGL
ncbi:MAG: PD-(D/E)XK nuclease family protein, partial [Hydrogenophaga sp.]|nr:PD-(D/E)XK nuclease family protein [Hydrogenophaga sp.]